MTFWDHLDELRGVIVRMLLVITLVATVAFVMKDELFTVVLAPRTSDFITYRLMGVEPFEIHLMNTGLTEQFMVHLKTAVYAGVLVASPYIIYLLFGFVAPALYDNERHFATLLCASGYLMFMLGTALNYLLIFPLTLKFLGTYQVSEDVANMLTLQSYIDDAGDEATCGGDNPDCSSNHYTYNRCLYALCGGTADMAALRTEHRDCEND